MARSGYLLDDLLTGSVFVLVGCQVAQRGVEPGAVEPGDVLDDGASGTGPGGPGLLVEALALEGGEERLGQSVVPALTGPPHRQLDVAVAGQVGEQGRALLTAPVRV